MVGIRRDHIYNMTNLLFLNGKVTAKRPRIIWFASNYPSRHLILERFGESIQSRHRCILQRHPLTKHLARDLYYRITDAGRTSNESAEAWIGGMLLSRFFNGEHPSVAPSDKTPYTRSLLRTLAPPEARITQVTNAGGESFIVPSQ